MHQTKQHQTWGRKIRHAHHLVVSFTIGSNRDFRKWIYFPTKSLSGYAFSSRADWNQVLVGQRVFCCSCVRTMPDWSVFEKYFSSKLEILLAFHPSPNTLHHIQYSGLPNLFKFFYQELYKSYIAWLPWNSFFRSKSPKIINFRKLKEYFVQFFLAI